MFGTSKSGDDFKVDFDELDDHAELIAQEQQADSKKIAGSFRLTERRMFGTLSQSELDKVLPQVEMLMAFAGQHPDANIIESIRTREVVTPAQQPQAIGTASRPDDAPTQADLDTRDAYIERLEAVLTDHSRELGAGIVKEGGQLRLENAAQLLKQAVQNRVDAKVAEVRASTSPDNMITKAEAQSDKDAAVAEAEHQLRQKVADQVNKMSPHMDPAQWEQRSLKHPGIPSGKSAIDTTNEPAPNARPSATNWPCA